MYVVSMDTFMFPCVPAWAHAHRDMELMLRNSLSLSSRFAIEVENFILSEVGSFHMV